MGEVMKLAGISLAETKFAMGGDFNHVVHHTVDKARVKVRSKKDNVAGKILFGLLNGSVLLAIQI
jgi:hypothetical protein